MLRKCNFFVLVPHTGKGHINDVGCFQRIAWKRERGRALGKKREKVKVIHLGFWKRLSPLCHSSILPRKHKEHYAWSPEGLWARTMLLPGSTIYKVTAAAFPWEFTALQDTIEYTRINEGLGGDNSYIFQSWPPPHRSYWSVTNSQSLFKPDMSLSG